MIRSFVLEVKCTKPYPKNLTIALSFWQCFLDTRRVFCEEQTKRTGFFDATNENGKCSARTKRNPEQRFRGQLLSSIRCQSRQSVSRPSFRSEQSSIRTRKVFRSFLWLSLTAENEVSNTFLMTCRRITFKKTKPFSVVKLPWEKLVRFDFSVETRLFLKSNRTMIYRTEKILGMNGNLSSSRRPRALRLNSLLYRAISFIVELNFRIFYSLFEQKFDLIRRSSSKKSSRVKRNVLLIYSRSNEDFLRVRSYLGFEYFGFSFVHRHMLWLETKAITFLCWS